MTRQRRPRRSPSTACGGLGGPVLGVGGGRTLVVVDAAGAAAQDHLTWFERVTAPVAVAAEVDDRLEIFEDAPGPLARVSHHLGFLLAISPSDEQEAI
jgi:hypothetical protein